MCEARAGRVPRNSSTELGKLQSHTDYPIMLLMHLQTLEEREDGHSPNTTSP